MIFNYSVLTRLLVTSRVIAILLPVQTKMFRTFYFAPSIFCSYTNQKGMDGQYSFLKKIMEREKYIYITCISGVARVPQT